MLFRFLCDTSYAAWPAISITTLSLASLICCSVFCIIFLTVNWQFLFYLIVHIFPELFYLLPVIVPIFPWRVILLKSVISAIPSLLLPISILLVPILFGFSFLDVIFPIASYCIPILYQHFLGSNFLTVTSK